MSPVSSLLGALFGGLGLAAEAQAENEAAAINSREWNRAWRASKAMEVDALRRGARQAGLLRMRGTHVQGQQRVVQAMGNVDASSGTAAQVSDATGIWASLDSETALFNARSEALGHRRVQQALVDEGRRAALERRNRDVGRLMRGTASILSLGAGGF